MEYVDSVIQLIKEYDCHRVAEIGVLRAHLAKEVLRACALDAYYLIDPWDASFGTHLTPAYWEDMAIQVYQDMLDVDIAHVIRLRSVDAAKLFQPKSLDMVFIDADHVFTPVSQDIEAWLPITKRILTGHDYDCERYPGLVRAVDARFEEVQVRPGTVWFAEVYT